MGKTSASNLRRAIIVCALGYFVDVFDIQVFTALRVPSLTDIGVSGDSLSSISGYILNAQMVGMIFGAFLWGWLGDRFGRLKALYGSILVYSVGTMLCGFVQDPYTYAFCRFVTGFGLAGEQGGAATLIAELMTPAKRSWGFAAIGGFGFLGPIAASLAALYFPWRQTYILGGLLGLALFALRMKLMEPELFIKTDSHASRRGLIRHLLRRKPLMVFLSCFAFGLPAIFNSFVLVFFSTEFSKAVLLPGENFDQRISLLFYYLGISCGSLITNAISQMWRSRRRALGVIMFANACFVGGFLLLGPAFRMTSFTLYAIYITVGATSGVSITMFVAEQFGTNIRATASIMLFNLIRGATIPMIFIFSQLRQAFSITEAALIVSAILYVGAFMGLKRLPETFARDLDYTETSEKRSTRQ